MTRVFRLLDGLVAVVAGGLVIAVAVLIGANVFNRYVLNIGFPWAEEIPGYMLVWISFLGAYMASRADGHIRFELLVDRAPPQVARALRWLAAGLVVALFATLTKLSIDMIGVVGHRSIETADIPRWVFLIILPISGALIAAATAWAAFRRERG